MAGSATQTQQFKVVGTRPIRHDGIDKVVGRAKYGADYSAPEMLLWQGAAQSLCARPDKIDQRRKGPASAGGQGRHHASRFRCAVRRSGVSGRANRRLTRIFMRSTCWPMLEAAGHGCGLHQGCSAEIGGGFGAKLYAFLEPLALLLSRKTGHPVKMVMNRTEVLRATGPTSGSRIRVKMGATKDGIITAAEVWMAFEAELFRAHRLPSPA